MSGKLQGSVPEHLLLVLQLTSGTSSAAPLRQTGGTNLILPPLAGGSKRVGAF